MEIHHQQSPGDKNYYQKYQLQEHNLKGEFQASILRLQDRYLETNLY